MGAPVCGRCEGKIPARDVAAYRREAGDPNLVPRLCDDCAETEEDATAAPSAPARKPIQDVQPADVAMVYRGRRGCKCGCRGSYYAASAHREAVQLAGNTAIVDDLAVLTTLREVQLDLARRPGSDLADGERGVYGAGVDGDVMFVYLREGGL
jgi:hypothetical protein